ncbi:glycoside hydrolase [Basidiobolus meristosporus CBS 931.73]|uniref:Glycoside hydrolase n=1 Tax=Basidiobolus meristosporus CBS 931.73 TaxID=1314790 RepID=A0A1Y1Y7F2_9FUNG|nr:glycoside hydrolase [Basidiobolus meristosporus CBS 931.73]|eukprot:ORX93825.1 glycoside hydrolase [Basidiobolus meristosporus CBS 931.73]
MSSYQPIVYPPLGSVTVVGNNQELAIRAYIPSSQGATVELWSNINNQEWGGISMARVPSQECETMLDYVAFEATLQPSSLADTTTFEYTVRFRGEADPVWSWAGQKGGNAKIIVSGEAAQEEIEVEGLFEVDGLPQWKFNKLRKNVWSLEVTAQFSNEIQQFNIGNIKSVVQWVGLKRRGLYWLEPLTGLRNPDFSDFDIQYLLWQRRDGTFGVLVPVADESCSAALRSNKEGKIWLSAINDTKGTTKAKILLSYGHDPFEVTKNCMKGARAIFAQADNVGGWHEKLYRRLGYCTWNAYYTDISHEKLVELAGSLKNSRVPVSYLIIDDGWLNISPSAQLKTMSADPNKFPHGLKAIISQIKEEYPNIQDVGVWHTLWGYWGGFSPDHEIGHKYRTVQVKLRNGGTVPLVHADDIERFFDDYHRYLQGQGVTLVKVDAQSSFDAIEFQSNESENPRTWWKAYQEALRKSTDKYFNGRVIYCMAQSPRLLFHQINRSEHAGLVVFRNSDDYFPDAPQEAQPWHVYTNTMNNLWTSQFPIRPDWDMFQSSHLFAQFHGAARAMNSGPVYITDHLDRFELDVIEALVDGVDARVLSSKSPGLPGRNELFIDPTKMDFALKMSHVDDKIGVSVIGLFNCRPNVIIGTFQLLDIPGSGSETRYPHDFVLYLMRKKRALRLGKGTSIKHISVGLKPREFEIATYYQLLAFRNEGRVVCLGALSKFSSASAISHHHIETSKSRDDVPTYRVSLKVRVGKISFYVSQLSKQSIQFWWNEKQVKPEKLHFDPSNDLVTVDLSDLKTDTVDTETVSPSTSLHISINTPGGPRSPERNDI